MHKNHTLEHIYRADAQVPPTQENKELTFGCFVCFACFPCSVCCVCFAFLCFDCVCFACFSLISNICCPCCSVDHRIIILFWDQVCKPTYWHSIASSLNCHRHEGEAWCLCACQKGQQLLIPAIINACGSGFWAVVLHSLTLWRRWKTQPTMMSGVF